MSLVQRTQQGGVYPKCRWEDLIAGVASHDTVNHSVTFVAPSGVHTQNILELYMYKAQV